MSGDDRDPLLEEETPRWRRRSSVVCMIVFLVGLVSLVSAILVGYFTVIKNDTVGKKLFDWIISVFGPGCRKLTFLLNLSSKIYL